MEIAKTENIIEIKNLNVIYNKGKSNQVRALENINLEIEPEEWVIIFGPSGCGKSTLLNSIAGFETPTSGKVVVSGEDINQFDSQRKSQYRRKQVGMIFQSFHLINSLKVLDNVCLPQVFFGVSYEKRAKTAKEFLERFGIANQAYKYPSDISGGQRQKVSIARALMNKPEIILADEPVGNLDSKSTYNVLAILKELNELDRKTIIMVTHNRNQLQYADKVVFVKDGKILKVEVLRRKRKSKDDKDDRRLVIAKDVEVPMDLKLLMNSFRDLANPNVGQLLTPFKVKQVFSHLMLPISNHQVELTQQNMKKFFLGEQTKKQFFDKLNASIEKGGAGWDKRSAERFSNEVEEVLTQSEKIEYSSPYRSAISLVNYFTEKYPIRKTEYRVNIFRSAVEKRLKNQISKEELQKILDNSLDEKGLGLNKKKAQKIARELELMILIRYAG